MAKLDEKIGFIGGGNMAFAIGSGLINREFVKTSQVIVSGPNIENLARWREIGIATTDDNYEVLDKADIIFICVKPHILTPMAAQLCSLHSPTLKDKDKLFVSVLAGVNLKTLEEKFSFINGLKMIRTMPNTPMQIGEGITVYTPGSYVKQQDLEKLHMMLNSLGIAQQVPEAMIDSVTGVAGCGPAFVYTIIEALADGGVKQGVPRQMALQFAAQMLLGSAKMVMLTGKHPAVLRDEVCSPGGATIVGVHELEKGNLRATLINAVEKSSQRAAELGKK
ncbi:pyrroline-5-carboxylate reductase 3 [Rhagoletis pomonella]|uniref:pyrroline-5-carboxylate reductase 3 n=2 Tax=Rhagoletis TaxID=28609 RepID=UPI00178627B3|nr:pyrroline-5-carboxylate reductase 3 [Rhagoletis pomonella]XP_036323016.1 pyrroline-5-carboxylate reductase 3 [Rhagoletis pomonella]XP_036323017.1 pyrroline-5-carboxylate reductase 3 [Rhagoletis pomonella]XP_036323018.1 pyrroline-5-carboxylate reductase 3 [Rhagoletis pomonella]